eukprot:gene41188-50262_t
MLCSRLRTSWHSDWYARQFGKWFSSQPAAVRIIVPGNHDMPIERMTAAQRADIFPDATFLLNESIEVFGLTIWGCPYSHGKSGNKAWQSPKFYRQSVDLANEMAGKVDVLITHGPCKEIASIVQPKLMYIYGHIHEHHGCQIVQLHGAAHSVVQTSGPLMTRKYIPNNHPVVADLFFGGHASDDGEMLSRVMSIRPANSEEIDLQPVHTRSHLSVTSFCTIS